MTISFTVYGKIVPKARPRVVQKRGMKFPLTYTPASTKKWEERVRLEALKVRPKIPLDGPLVLTCIFFFQLSKSKKEKDKTKQPYWCIGRSDYDNLAKCITDATEKILFRNDNQIVSAVIQKRYTENAERVEIKISTTK